MYVLKVSWAPRFLREMARTESKRLNLSFKRDKNLGNALHLQPRIFFMQTC